MKESLVPYLSRKTTDVRFAFVPSDRKIRKFIRRWRRRYPYPFEWVSDRANRQCRKSEEQWLVQFAGASTLKRRQVLALTEWIATQHPLERERAVTGVAEPAQWGYARRRIKKALSTPNPIRALDCLLEECEGIAGWGPYMASVVLAACRPETYAIADVRALATLEALKLYAPTVKGEFSRSDWWPYLHLCRNWAKESNLSPREVSQALSVAATEAPDLPKSPKRPKVARSRS